MPPELPDDPREWPKDPFALLGVERGVDDTTVRRAYTQLIRKYKPEHHPEQFCKIREAYETCRQQAAWFRPEPAPSPEADEKPLTSQPLRAAPAADNRPGEAQPISEEESQSPLARWSAPVVEERPSEAERLWTEATAGNMAAAYAGLVPLAKDDADAALRLYWLLAVDPKLDRERTRHHWLHAALTLSRFSPATLEVYRRELEADPAAALADPFGRLLETDTSWGQLVHAAQMRTAAAGRAGQLWLVETDLKHVKSRVGLDNDADWLNLVVSALDWAAWDQSNLVAAFCQNELPALRHLQLHHGYQFDRVDQALYWGGLATMAGQPNLVEFFHLLGQLWASPGPVDRADLNRGLAPLASHPHRTLGWFDSLFLNRGPNLGILATRMLGRHCHDLDPPHPPDLLRGYVRRVPGIRKESWPVLRSRLLDVLARLRLHPEELAEACAADPEPRFREVADALRGDLSLQIAWLAVSLCPAGQPT